MNQTQLPTELDPPKRVVPRIIPHGVLLLVAGSVAWFGMLPLPPPVSNVSELTDTVVAVDCHRYCSIKTQRYDSLYAPPLARLEKDLENLRPGTSVTLETYPSPIGERVVSLRTDSNVIYSRDEALAGLWFQSAVAAAMAALFLYGAFRVGWRGTYVHRLKPPSPEELALDRSGRAGGLALVGFAAMLFVAAVSLAPHNQPSAEGDPGGLHFAASFFTAMASCTVLALGAPNVVYGSPVPRTTWPKKALVSVPAGVLCTLLWATIVALKLPVPWR